MTESYFCQYLNTEISTRGNKSYTTKTLNIFYSMYVICKSTCPETTSPQWCHLWTIQACLPWQPPFLQHVLWRCCNPPGIPSFTAEILLFNSVFHDGVAPVSVSTLKPLLRVIGVLPLKPRASPIISVVYKTSSYTVIC